ncbi:XrtA/PEP-CTERM system TPR-repeat protein PrsT [Elioraea sp.]|uniref:XrtA/PEP-CTERM system TPR-repeat protein PrsT n=1 Tax=Elioraea sp. TaxID=2185103 RepID=UPI003F6F70E2
MARPLTTRIAAPLAFAAALMLAVPADASVDRARAAQQRGDLRAAQIEFRNAVRASPDDPALRAALARASLDLGDGDTAEKEARAALERGYDRADGTALLLRAYMTLRRFEEILREFPMQEGQVPNAVAGQVAAGRSMAYLALNRREDAARAAADAVRLAPDRVDPQLAAATVAAVAGDRDASEAAVDRALAIEPDNADALLRKGGFQFERGQLAEASTTFARVLELAPGHIPARLRRGEVLLRMGNDAEARQEIDRVLRLAPSAVLGIYMSAMLHGRAQDWPAADEALQRIQGQLPNIPDGLLLFATVKRALNQLEQAEDAARRHVARRPEDPRGAKLLATLELQRGAADAAAGTLDRLAQRGAADAEAYDLLGRAHAQMGRRQEALDAFSKASELAADNAGVLARLAVARLATGDAGGAQQAAEAALARNPDQAGAREILASAALARGDLAAASAQLERLGPAARGGELAGVLDGTIRVVRLDIEGGKQAFEAVLRDHPNSVRARLGLARVAAMQGDLERAERLFGEVLEREPGNPEALARLSAAVITGGPRAASSRAVLETANAAQPGDPALAMALGTVLVRAGEPAKAAAVLDAPAFRERRRETRHLLLLAEARAAAEQPREAEEAARAAMAQDPDNPLARRVVAGLLLRANDPRAAETVLEQGLRSRPTDALLQQSLIQTVREGRGLDAALEVADRLARQEATRPTSLTLRGDLLMGAERFEEAAAAYAAAYQQAPSGVLAQRRAAALQRLGRTDQVMAALAAWLERQPGDTPILALLSQIEIGTGKTVEAERRLVQVVAARPEDAVSLNNLAWLMQARSTPETAEGRATLAQARQYAERAYYLAPSAETADTLGWILARTGEAARAVPLLRQAAAASMARQRPDASMFYRYAVALDATGQREEARRVIEPVVASTAQFPERAEAERLLARLRGG